MAQVFATTLTVTATTGYIWHNKPVEPTSVVRFLCDIRVRIDGSDHNTYPAIRFDLDTKAVQFWVYDSKAIRDADCEMLADAIGPAPSLYTAYWDVTGNNLPNINPDAIFIGGVSGTHEADQLYFDIDGVSPMPVPFDGLLQVRGLGSPFNIADFDAANGTSLALIGSWSGTFAAQVAANITGTVGHTNLLQFAKLTFATTLGLTYASAIALRWAIKTRKSGDLSGNTGNLLTMPIKLNQGTLNRCTDLDIRNGIIYCSMFGNATGINQGLTTVKVSDKWSKRNYNTQVNDTGTFARTIRDSDSPTGLSLIVFIRSGVSSPLSRTQIAFFDGDGMPQFAAPTAINGVGAGRNGTQRLVINGTLESGAMPVVLYSKFNSFPVELVANTGTGAAPDYSLNLDMNAVDATLVNSYDGETATDGRTYLVHGNPGNNFRATLVSRLTYSGPSTAIGYTTAGNWSREAIGTSAGTGAAVSGDGLTFVGTLNGFAMDQSPSEVVNGEPTMYASDEQSEVIFKITRKATSFGDERDWDFLIVAGTGASGNVDGVGTLASFTDIRYLKINGDYLYINTAFGAYSIRRMNVKNLVVDTFIGLPGTPGIQPQFSY
jgi:hypothetical protein